MSIMTPVLLVLANLLLWALGLLGLPGNWLMIAATALVAWWQWDRGMFSPWTLIAVLVLALIAELLEFISSALSARTLGGSRKGALGALAGGILGAIIGAFIIPVPLFGPLLGGCAGAALGALTMEMFYGRPFQQAARTGAAAGLGFVAGTMLKLGIGLVIWFIIAVAAFWP